MPLALFQNVRLARVHTMSEVTKLVSRMTMAEDNFAKMALDVVTEPKIRRYLEESTIISNLFEYGQASRKLRFPGEGAMFFESVKEVEARMSQLYDFWSGSVNITCDVADESMVEVTFRVKELRELL